ncbi:histidine kinase, partial [Levilactobacillus parabrevis]|nr:histidine kinase [Levilactobacillus parabrevis]
MRRLLAVLMICGSLNSLLVWCVRPSQLGIALLIAWSLALIEMAGVSYLLRWGNQRIGILTKKVEGIRHEE